MDEFRVIFDIIDSSGSGELDLLGVKRACGLMGHKSCVETFGKEFFLAIRMSYHIIYIYTRSMYYIRCTILYTLDIHFVYRSFSISGDLQIF